jgi:hypothetical protein
MLPLDRTHIYTFDLARIFHNKTELPGHWAILRQALQLYPGEWAQVNQRFIMQQSLLEVIQFAFDIWSGRLGLEDPTVGVLCDSLYSLGHRADAGKRND